jgi:hypothetical protein
MIQRVITHFRRAGSERLKVPHCSRWRSDEPVEYWVLDLAFEPWHYYGTELLDDAVAEVRCDHRGQHWLPVCSAHLARESGQQG